MLNRKQDPKPNSNLKVYLSIINLRFFEVKECISSLQEEMDSSKSLKYLECIENGLQAIRTLYTMSMLHILDCDSEDKSLMDEISKRE